MNNKGIALLMSLVLIVLVVFIVINILNTTWVDVSESAIFRDRALAKINLISALNYATALLVKDAQTNNIDTLRDNWADKEEISKAFSEWAGEDVEIFISDETGKLNINSLVKQDGQYNANIMNVLLRLLKGPFFKLSAEDAQNLLDSIKDWIDKDDEPTRFGAESGYYKDLGLKYGAKNSAIDFLEELLTVKGMTPEIFYGTGESPGLKDLLRTRGPTTININTAPGEIILALGDNMTWDAVAAMLDYRLEQGNELGKKDWYKSVPGMAGVALDESIITTKGELFKVVVVQRTSATRRNLIALLERKGKDVKILDLKVE
jgi:general secretion pathway protein K